VESAKDGTSDWEPRKRENTRKRESRRFLWRGLIVHLGVAPPFSLEKTVRALQRTPANQVEVWDEGEYRRLLRVDGRDLALRITQPEPAVVEVACEDAPLAPDTTERIGERVRWMLGLDADLAPFRERAARYPALARLAEQLAGMQPPRFPTLFEALINTVLFQQISLAVGVSLVNRLAATFGARREIDGHMLSRLPTAAELLRLTEEDLRGIHLSGAKARALLTLAAAVEEGELDSSRLAALPDEALQPELVRHRGIGPWSAQVVMLRGFGRLSVFPAGDSGADRALRTFFDLSEAEAPTRIAALLDHLGDQRGYLYFCMLGWRLLRQGVITPAG
jgi:3-methyladenine DNA glycosylase/8-oxoguanine DNA glycosylase